MAHFQSQRSDQRPFTHLFSEQLHGNGEFKSTWVHRAWLITGCTSVAISLGKSITGSIASRLWFQSLFAAFIDYLAADLYSGLYHWAIDNKGGPETPIFGSYINTFQGHHRWPSSSTYYEPAESTYKIARGVTFLLFPLDFLITSPVLLSYLGVYTGFAMFGLQFHAWAHRPRNRLPSMVVVLQEMGVLISLQKHAKHHRPPFQGSYCTVSGMFNDFLDKLRVLEGMEMVLFSIFGVRPRSWSEDSKPAPSAITPK